MPVSLQKLNKANIPEILIQNLLFICKAQTGFDIWLLQILAGILQCMIGR